MTDLTKIEAVTALKQNLRATLETDAGAEVIKFMEEVCGWYDFRDTDPNTILINHGKRQVLATIKTLMRLSPEQIVAMTKEQ